MTDLDHRSLAVSSYNRCWELLDLDQRTDDEDADLLTCALASRYHWAFCGGAEQLVVADWMVSRAAAAIGEPALSLLFAERAFDLVQRGIHPAWLRASVFEGLARAHASQGGATMRDRYVGMARLVARQEDDEESRLLIIEQIESLPAAIQRQG